MFFEVNTAMALKNVLIYQKERILDTIVKDLFKYRRGTWQQAVSGIVSKLVKAVTKYDTDL